jgi:hypothetical protein
VSVGRLGVLALIVLSATAVATTPVLAKGKADHKTSPITLASFPTALTKKQAVQVVLQYSRENDLANKKLSVDLQNKDEEGIQARMDDAAYNILSLEGKTNDGTSSYLPKTKNISVYVTGATKAPAELLAAIKYPAATKPTAYPAGTSYYLFRKDSRAAPWRLVYGDTSVSSKTKVITVQQNSGLASVKANASNSAIGTIAKYLSSGVGNVAPGTYTSADYSSQTKAISQAKSDGVDLSYLFSAEKSSVVSVAVKGGLLEFGTIANVETTTPADANRCVSSNASDDAAYLTLVPSGIDYSQIVLHQLVQVTLFVPSNKHEPIHLLTDYEQMMSASAPACEASAPQPTTAPQPAATPVPATRASATPAPTTPPPAIPSPTCAVTPTGFSCTT